MGLFDEQIDLSKYTKPPEEAVVTDTAEPIPEASAQPPVTETPKAEAPVEQVQPAKAEEVKPDKFFEDFNKRFNTSFKSDDDVKNVLGYQQKIAEYEPKVKLAEDYAKKIEDYERQLEENKNNGNTELLSKPLLRKAYVADQLLAKYPDKDPYTLQEIVMVDVSKLSDLDVLIKNQKIDLPNLSESDIKAVLLDKYGIDPETKPEEWSSISKAKIAIDAQSARVNIKALTNGIELPKAVTKEERESALAKAMEERVRQTEPLKAEFLAFDKFKKGDFEFDTTGEYKSKLPDMFDAFFIQAEQEPTKENLQAAIELRDSVFLYQNFDKIKEVIEKNAQVPLQKKLDEALSNTTLPNTTTATDQGTQADTRPGLAAFLEKNR